MSDKKREEIIIDDFPRNCLVLTRRVGEGARITMGDIEVEAVVVSISGKAVRLAVKAPKSYGLIDRVSYLKTKK